MVIIHVFDGNFSLNQWLPNKLCDLCIGHNEIIYHNLLLSFGKPSVLKESRSWFMIKDPFVHALRRTQLVTKCWRLSSWISSSGKSVERYISDWSRGLTSLEREATGVGKQSRYIFPISQIEELPPVLENPRIVLNIRPSVVVYTGLLFAQSDDEDFSSTSLSLSLGLHKPPKPQVRKFGCMHVQKRKCNWFIWSMNAAGCLF